MLTETKGGSHTASPFVTALIRTQDSGTALVVTTEIEVNVVNVKLNGWKRLGIVASVIWIIATYLFTFNQRRHSQIRFAHEVITPNCIAAYKEEANCSKVAEDYIIRTSPGDRIEAAVVALVPVPLAWGFAYLAIFVVRRIKRPKEGIVASQ